MVFFNVKSLKETLKYLIFSLLFLELFTNLKSGHNKRPNAPEVFPSTWISLLLCMNLPATHNDHSLFRAAALQAPTGLTAATRVILS